MSSVRSGASVAPENLLLHLPRDVALNILRRLSPIELAAFSQLCREASRIADDEQVWRAAAARHLADLSVRPTSCASFYALAQKLVCRWWLLTGAFVAGMPVHRRRGFIDVHARGGQERLIHPNSATTCYVMGDPDPTALIWPTPAVHLSFFLDAKGPFPVDGMRARLIHAIENPKPIAHPSAQSDPASTPTSTTSNPISVPPLSIPPLSHITPTASAPSPVSPHSDMAISPPPYLSLNGVPAPVSIAQQRAPVRVTIKINNNVILKDFRPEAPHFSVLDVSIPTHLLYSKPRANVLSIELNKYPNECYWLREVSIMPSILPAPAVDKASLIFPRNEPQVSTTTSEDQPDVAPVTWPPPLSLRPLTHPSPPSNSPRARRHHHSRQTSHLSTTPHPPRSPPVSHRTRDSPRRAPRMDATRHKRSKQQPFQKAPRHMYHHSNYRSPRGSSHHNPKN
ncbi:hypothetical protein BWQ96_06444 [Gracilariopsis chorda]|uniref:F-box domain-containing protein n=1 Tax=Gracilariopsis chorda TaxID=448386 RepID=A0A2V3IP35_9FLOR|nr:hypothetical protein BWQ96_06444 [Gracilariopsis chorda]|eukprot:PXF43823.1 hypothetical protein BWQ96_06444 [Gracilariopsis chorda]